MTKKKLFKQQADILWDALNAISVGSSVDPKEIAKLAMDEVVQLEVDKYGTKTRKEIRNELLENRRIIEAANGQPVSATF